MKNKNTLTYYLDLIQEVKKSSVVRVTRKSKINRAIGSLSTSMAKKKNDPLYQKMIYYKTRYKKYKAQLVKKYASRVRSQARK